MMKKLLIMIGVICYCVSPDLFFGPMDDAVIVLAGIAQTLLGAGARREPEWKKWNVNV